MSSPTKRSLDYLRKDGYLAAVVEKWNPHTKTRHDLFGVIDILGIRDGETIAIQATSGSNVSARLKKITESDALPDIRKAGWKFFIHGWRKAANGRWVLREVDVS